MRKVLTVAALVLVLCQTTAGAETTARIKDGKWTMQRGACSGMNHDAILDAWEDELAAAYKLERRLFQVGDMVVMEVHRQETRRDDLELESFIAGVVSGDTMRLQEVLATDGEAAVVTWAGTVSKDGKKIAYTYWFSTAQRLARGQEYRDTWYDGETRFYADSMSMEYVWKAAIKCQGTLTWAEAAK